MFVAAVLIAFSLWFMMREFDHYGLSYLAVMLGFFAVAILLGIKPDHPRMDTHSDNLFPKTLS